MTTRETKTLANIEKKIDDMQSEINKINVTLASWTGGRKALVWGISVLLGIGIIIVTIFEAIKDVGK